jgi:hypothetical protein
MGYMTGNLIDPSDLVQVLDTVIRCGSAIPSLTLAPLARPRGVETVLIKSPS